MYVPRALHLQKTTTTIITNSTTVTKMTTYKILLYKMLLEFLKKCLHIFYVTLIHKLSLLLISKSMLDNINLLKIRFNLFTTK